MIATTPAPFTGDPRLAIVIDDESKICEFIAATLVQLGMRVESFIMANEALAAIEHTHPAIVFVDVALLRSDAIDVIRGLSKCRYGGVVQLMSGGRPSLLEAIQRIGMRHGMKLATPLNKPLAREAILQVIGSLPSPDSTLQADRQAAPETIP